MTAINHPSFFTKINDTPCVTFIIKGLINSGKSTLFNAIFSRNISKTSIKRQTMCQIIFEECPTERNLDHTELYSLIEANNKELYIQTEKGHSVPVIPEIERKVPVVEKFFNHIEGINYRYIETVGFDDPKTDTANNKWFAENTQWADVLFFVTDKEKCMNTATEQTLFKTTVKDLMNCYNDGKLISLIIVINKVEDIDDPEVQDMINQCKSNVERILAELKAIDIITYKFSVISAMKSLYYRLFLVNNSFNGMEQKDIIKFAEMELGREGKSLANDTKNHTKLALIIKNRLDNDNSGIQWQQECGINELIQCIDELILTKENLPKLLLGQLELQIKYLTNLTKNMINYQLNNYQEILMLILKSYKCYNNTLNQLLNNNNKTNNSNKNITEYLLNIKNKAIELFQNIWKSLSKKHSTNILITDMITHLLLMYEFDMSNNKEINQNIQNNKKNTYKTVKMIENSLLTQKEWNELITYIIKLRILLLWNDNNVNSVNYYSNFTNYERIELAAKTTIDILLNKNISYLLEEFYQTIINDIITTLPDNCLAMKSNQSNNNNNSNDKIVILMLETLFLLIINNITNNNIKKDFYIQIIQRKMKLNQYLFGYTISLHELLNDNNNILMKKYYFFLFANILYQNIPSNDFVWLNTKTIKNNYQIDIMNHSALISENLLFELTRNMFIVDMTIDNDNENNDNNEMIEEIEANNHTMIVVKESKLNTKRKRIEK